MMGAIIAKRSVNIHLTSELVSRGYVDMTIEVIKQFGSDVKQTEDGFEVICKNKVSIGCEFVPEVDYSNLAFWEVAGVHLPLANDNNNTPKIGAKSGISSISISIATPFCARLTMSRQKVILIFWKNILLWEEI